VSRSQIENEQLPAQLAASTDKEKVAALLTQIDTYKKGAKEHKEIDALKKEVEKFENKASRNLKAALLRKTLLEDKETEVQNLTAKLAVVEEKLNALATKATETDSRKAELEQLQKRLELRDEELQTSRALADNATDQWQKEKQEAFLRQTQPAALQDEIHSVRAVLKERNTSEAEFLSTQMSREVSKLTAETAAADIDRLEALTYRLKLFASEEPVQKHTSRLALRLWRLYRSMDAAARGGDSAVAEKVATVAELLHEVHVEQSQTKMET